MQNAYSWRFTAAYNPSLKDCLLNRRTTNTELTVFQPAYDMFVVCYKYQEIPIESRFKRRVVGFMTV